MGINKIYQGDSLEVLRTFEDGGIDMCMTSPPYWGLRNYNIEGQLGLEKTFEEYITKLCDIFDEVKRVLKDTGSCWVNLGDTYNNSSWGKPDKFDKKIYNLNRMECGRGGMRGYPDKCLCQIPQRFSIEMTNRGWILRNVIIWHKPNCMPSSVKDRFTIDFEYLFFFAKSRKYYFETQLEPLAKSSLIDPRLDRGREEHIGKSAKGIYSTNATVINSEGRNKRCVWRITTKPFSESHFATYPEALCETPIRAGCPEGGIVLDMFFGAGTTGLVALKQNKKFIGIELNPEYIDIAKKRLKPYLEQKQLNYALGKVSETK